MRQYENNINVKLRPVSSVRIRFVNHKEIRTFLTHIAPCKWTHCWPTTPNIVGCHMLRPFTRPVACSCCCIPNLFICALVMFLNRVFRQEWFNRFPYICKFEVNRDRRTRCTNSWSDLTLKCNAYTFLKVDERREENCRRTISCLQGYSCPKLQP